MISAVAFDLNCCNFCNSCHSLQFTTFKHVFEVAADSGLVHPEEACHAIDRQPDGFFAEQDFHFYGAAIRGIEEKLAGFVTNRQFVFLGRHGQVARLFRFEQRVKAAGDRFATVMPTAAVFPAIRQSVLVIADGRHESQCRIP